MSYTNESTLVLFPNDKQGNPKRPDYRGKIQLNGESFKVSVWERTSKDGKGTRYLSGPIERDQFNSQPPAPVAPTPAPAADSGDSIPF